MSKKIIKIEQIEEGGKNEKGVVVDKLWKLYFEDTEAPRILDKTQLQELAQKGTSPPKSIFSVTRWGSTFSPTLTEKTFYWWIIIYDDRNHTVLLSKEFYDLLYEGHRKEEPDKEEIIGDRGDISKAVSGVMNPPRITTEKEQQELHNLRKKIDADEAFRIGLHLNDDEIEEAENE